MLDLTLYFFMIPTVNFLVVFHIEKYDKPFWGAGMLRVEFHCGIWFCFDKGEGMGVNRKFSSHIFKLNSIFVD